ncbi:MAG TPA: GlsB/YeaQ/YmgE family stress response membrane protein [Armatimonadota bacterium]|jgi:uncharacterized membrane protein YeaQ/YmgE (transglycosylase-associated protein family)
MQFLLWIIVGLIAGALANQTVPVRGATSTVGDLIIGVVGALLGGTAFFYWLGLSSGGLVGSVVVACVGAALLLLVLRGVAPKTSV